MQENKRSVGSALIEVFDAGVTLAKTEAKALVRQGTDIAKAKGMGVVFLLAAVAPLSMALIFLILALFYLLSLYMPAWLAALLVALLGLILTGILAMMGISKLKAEPEDLAQDDVAGGPYDRPYQGGTLRRLDDEAVPVRDVRVTGGSAVIDRGAGPGVRVHGRAPGEPMAPGAVVAGGAGAVPAADLAVREVHDGEAGRAQVVGGQISDVHNDHGPNPTYGTRLSESMLHTEAVQGDPHEDTSEGTPVSVKPTSEPER